MRIILIALVTALLFGCAKPVETYGVPMSVWNQLTPEQQRQLATYDDESELMKDQRHEESEHVVEEVGH